MTSGTAPDLPESGWRVDHQDALRNWLGTNPPLSYLTPVTEWIRGCQQMGPPPDGVPVGEDFHVARVAGAAIAVSYLIVEFEFLVIVKQFR